MTSRNQKNFEFKLGKQGLFLFVVGMSLLLFVVFVSGVMVGIHIDAYPERIAQSIPDIIKRHLHHPTPILETIPVGRDELKPPVGSEENNAGILPADLTVKPALPPPGNSGTAEKKILPAPLQMDQEGSAKKPRTSTAQNGTITLKPPANAPPPSLKNQAGIAPPSESKTAKPSANLPPPAGIVKPSAMVPPTAAGKEEMNVKRPPDSETAAGKPLLKAGGEYLVQAGSYQSHNKAIQFSHKIAPLGYKPRVMMVDLPKKGKWFRVVIGGFATKDEAVKAADLLSKKIKGLNCVVHPANQ